MCGVVGPVEKTAFGDCIACDYELERLAGTTVTAFNTTKTVTLGNTNTFLYRVVPPAKGRFGTLHMHLSILPSV